MQRKMYTKAVIRILAGALVSVALFTGCAPGPASTTPPIGNGGGPSLMPAPPSANHYGDDKFILSGPIGVAHLRHHARHHAGHAGL